jgi:hypothetical protein
MLQKRPPLPPQNAMLEKTKLVFSVIKNIPYYIGLFYKAVEVRNGITLAIKEFPGIADEESLFRWCTENSDRLVNYATYTTFTEVDDYIAWQVRLIFTEHWTTIIAAIRAIKNGQVKETEIAKLMSEEILNSNIVNGVEAKDPFTVISIVSIILSIIRVIIAAKSDDTTPQTETDNIEIQPKKRPIRDLVRKLLGKE